MTREEYNEKRLQLIEKKLGLRGADGLLYDIDREDLQDDQEEGYHAEFRPRKPHRSWGV